MLNISIVPINSIIISKEYKILIQNEKKNQNQNKNNPGYYAILNSNEILSQTDYKYV